MNTEKLANRPEGRNAHTDTHKDAAQGRLGDRKVPMGPFDMSVIWAIMALPDYQMSPFALKANVRSYATNYGLRHRNWLEGTGALI